MTTNSAGSRRALTLADLEGLLDKQALYENAVLYCRGQDRKDLELMKSTFWPDATDDHGIFVGSAHEFCEWTFARHKQTQHVSQHYLTNVHVELDGDRARRESVFVYVMVRTDGVRQLQGGRYRDLCERRGSEWKVLRRVVITDHVGEFTTNASLENMFGGFPSGAARGDVYPRDPIYDSDW
ncbi:nuclear transport factor 2 family protein [Nocardioides campestrisoli]|uniref:nuclear transport factor 2 family protein n=1 Tax=Nocardioides campestrisoli TaxID=2736757 RepID=UPI0015E6FBAC|nr:nuclear transport factor 2 family protein [Nocardioides campestrisoli]